MASNSQQVETEVTVTRKSLTGQHDSGYFSQSHSLYSRASTDTQMSKLSSILVNPPVKPPVPRQQHYYQSSPTPYHDHDGAKASKRQLSSKSRSRAAIYSPSVLETPQLSKQLTHGKSTSVTTTPSTLRPGDSRSSSLNRVVPELPPSCPDPIPSSTGRSFTLGDAPSPPLTKANLQALKNSTSLQTPSVPHPSSFGLLSLSDGSSVNYSWPSQSRSLRPSPNTRSKHRQARPDSDDDVAPAKFMKTSTSIPPITPEFKKLITRKPAPSSYRRKPPTSKSKTYIPTRGNVSGTLVYPITEKPLPPPPSESDNESSADCCPISLGRAPVGTNENVISKESVQQSRSATPVHRPDLANGEYRDLDLTGEVVKYKQITTSDHSNIYRGTLSPYGTNFKIVIKSLRERGSQGTQADMEHLRERCCREVLFWRRNILPLHGFTMLTNQASGLISQWYTNGNIIRYLELCPNVDRHALALDVVNGLDYLHSIQVVHGNLQEENVLMDDHGRALCGFTKSKFVDETCCTAGPKTNIDNTGSTRFTSPELFGDESELSTAAEIWALGSLIVEILTEVTPYEHISAIEDVKSAITRGELPSTNSNGSIRTLLSDCIRKCWSISPDDRPKASEVALHLTTVMSDGLDVSNRYTSGKVTTNKQMNWGSFSDVWRGTLLIDVGQTDVALKALRAQKLRLSSSQPSIEEHLQKRFRREVSLWWRLKHPNIVPLLGYTTHLDNPPTLISPWCANGNLIEYLELHPSANRYSLASDIISAMQYRRSILVVHCDLKGKIVVVNLSGSTSLCDFGISKLLDEAIHITTCTTTNTNARGTDHYMLMDDGLKTTMTTMPAFAYLVVLTLTDQTPYHSIIKRHRPTAILRGDSPNTNTDGLIDEALWTCLANCWSIGLEVRPSISDPASYLLLQSGAVWRRSMKRLVPSHVLEGHGWKVSSVRFSPNGKYLASAAVTPGCHQVSVQLVPVGSAAHLVCYVIDTSGAVQAYLSRSRTENHLMITTGDEYMSILEVKIECILRHIYVSEEVDGVAWLLGGIKVACSGGDELCIMDRDGDITATYSPPTRRIRSMNFISEDISLLLGAQEDELLDNRMIFYNRNNSQLEHTIMPGRPPCGILLSKDRKYLSVTHYEGPELWEIHSNELKNPRLSFLHAFKSDQGYPISNAALFGGLGDQFVINASSGGVIHYWDRNGFAQSDHG